MPDDVRPVALVTGASRGIGRAITLALARTGYDCCINYARNAEAAATLRGEIEAIGRRAFVVQADIASTSDRRKLVDQTLAHLGAIDLLVNNAGVAPEQRADILEATEESFDHVINTNLKGPYF